MLGCSMSRSSMGLVSAVAPSAVKQGGGVTNQLSSMPQRSSPPLLPPLQSLQEPGDTGAEPRGRWAGLGSAPLTPTNPAEEEEEEGAWQMGEEEGEEVVVGNDWRGEGRAATRALLALVLRRPPLGGREVPLVAGRGVVGSCSDPALGHSLLGRDCAIEGASAPPSPSIKQSSFSEYARARDFWMVELGHFVK